MQPKLKILAPVTIDVAGTEEPLSATSIKAASVLISADNGNTGKVYVGDSTVSSANGIELAAGECISIEGEELRGNFLEVDLADIYVDTETNGNVVRVAYMARR